MKTYSVKREGVFGRLALLHLLAALLIGCSQTPAETADATGSTPNAETIVPTHPPAVSLSLWAEWQMAQSDASWSPDSRDIVVSGSDGRTYLYDVSTRQTVWEINDATISPIFSPDGRIIVGADNRIPIIEADNGELEYSSEGGNAVLYTAFLPDGSALLLGRSWLNQLDETAVTEIGTWDIEEGLFDLLISLDGHLGFLTASPDGSMLAAGLWNVNGMDGDRLVYLWDFPSLNELCDFTGEKILFSSPNNFVAVSDYDGNITLYNIATCKAFETIPAEVSIFGLGFSLDGNTLAYAGDPCCEIHLFDILGGEILFRQMVSLKNIDFLAFSPDGNFLLSISSGNSDGRYEQVLQIWKVNQLTQ